MRGHGADRCRCRATAWRAPWRCDRGLILDDADASDRSVGFTWPDSIEKLWPLLSRQPSLNYKKGDDPSRTESLRRNPPRSVPRRLHFYGASILMIRSTSSRRTGHAHPRGGRGRSDGGLTFARRDGISLSCSLFLAPDIPGCPSALLVRAFPMRMAGLRRLVCVTARSAPDGIRSRTRIVPRHKNRIGDTPHASADQFLLPRLIARKMQTVDVAGAGAHSCRTRRGGGGSAGSSRTRRRLARSTSTAGRHGQPRSPTACGTRRRAVLCQGCSRVARDGMPLLVRWSNGDEALDSTHLIHQMCTTNNAIGSSPSRRSISTASSPD